MKYQSNDIDYIKSRIRKDDLKGALLRLEQVNPRTGLRFLSKLARQDKLLQEGLISLDDYNVEKNRLNNRLLSCIEGNRFSVFCLREFNTYHIGMLSMASVLLLSILVYSFLTVGKNASSSNQSRVKVLTEFSNVIGKIAEAASSEELEAIKARQKVFKELYFSKISQVDNLDLQNGLRFYRDSINRFLSGVITKNELLKTGLVLNDKLAIEIKQLQ